MIQQPTKDFTLKYQYIVNIGIGGWGTNIHIIAFALSLSLTILFDDGLIIKNIHLTYEEADS